MRSILFSLCLFVFGVSSVEAATETVRLYPVLDGRTFEDRQTSWNSAVNSVSARIASQNATNQDLSNSIGNGFGPTHYSLNRLHFGFDTSVIPADAVIDSATFNVFGFAPDETTGSERRIYLVSSDPATLGLLAVGDYSRVGSTLFGATDGTWNIDSENIISLNADGLSYIDTDDTTYFALRGWYDINEVTPTNENELYVNVYLSEGPGTTFDPFLEITYTVPDEPVDLSESVAACWAFEETSSTRFDESDNNNDLTDFNAVPAGTGKIGDAIDLDSASNQYLSVTESDQTDLDFSGDFSFSVWVNPASFTEGDYVFMEGNQGDGGKGVLVFIENNGQFKFAIDDGVAAVIAQSDPGVFGLDEWHHVVGTRVGSMLKLYVDGVLVDEVIAYETNINSTEDFYVGARNRDGVLARHFDGAIDELALWSRALNGTEVAALYNAGDGLGCQAMLGTAPAEPETIPELANKLIDLIESGDYAKNQQKSYLAHLKKVETFVSSGKVRAAKEQVQQFIFKVQNDYLKGKLTQEQADELLEPAEALLALIEDILNSDDDDEVPLLTQIASPYAPGSDEWEHDPLGSGATYKCGSTIGQCGCAITSAAMIGLGFGAEKGIDGTEINPRNFNNWLSANGGYSPSDDIIWRNSLEYFADENGRSRISLIDDYQKDNDKIAKHLNAGGLAVGFSETHGHYFTLTESLLGGGYAIRDPLWFETQTTNETKDIANDVQSYGGDVTKAKLFWRSDKLALLPSGIELHLASPAELLLIDSSGRRTGYDPETGEFLNEIPNSSYDRQEFIASSDELVDEDDIHYKKVLSVGSPEGDLFELKVVGTGEGDYALTVFTTGGGLASEVENIFSSTTVNQVDEYLIDVPDTEKVSRAPARLRELADQKEADKPEVAAKLRENADRLENKNVVATDAEVTDMLAE